MLQRFNIIKNVGRFDDLKCGKGTQDYFGKFTVIYARNGSGKTTICDILRSLGCGDGKYVDGRHRFNTEDLSEIELQMHAAPGAKFPVFRYTRKKGWTCNLDEHPKPKCLVYDERFIADNILIGQSVTVEHKRSLYGLALGERAIELAQALQSAEDELRTATAEVANATSQIMVPTGYTLDTFIKITHDSDLKSQIQQTTTELETAKQAIVNAERIRALAPFQVFDVPNVPDNISDILTTTLSSLAVQAEERINVHRQTAAPTLSMSWMKQGFDATIGSNCPYCGQDTSTADIVKCYGEMFRGLLETHQNEQQRLLETANAAFGINAQERLRTALAGHSQTRDNWHAVGVSLPFNQYGDATTFLEAMANVHKVIVASLRRKQEAPAQATSLTPDERKHVDDYTNLINPLSQYRAQLIALNTQINAIKTNAGRTEVKPLEDKLHRLKVQEMRYALPVVEQINRYNTAVATQKQKQTAKTKANEEHREEVKSIIIRYKDRINALLGIFKASIRVSERITYHGGPPAVELVVTINGTQVSGSPDDAKNASVPSLANTISAGDRSALCLAFFIAKYESDTKLPESILVFDDPFNSQDQFRRGKTLEQIIEMSEKAMQTFVLSHELNFAREAAGRSRTSATFELDNSAIPIELKLVDLPALAAGCHILDYAALKACSEGKPYIGDEITTARRMRQVLETFLRTKFPERWQSDVWLGDMIGDIRKAGETDVLHKAKHLYDALNHVNEWGKRYYHTCNDDLIDPTDLRTYAEETIDILHR